MFGSKLSTRDLWLFADTLASALASGAPITGAADSLARDVPAGKLRRALRALSTDLQQGISFSDAIGAQPAAFPDTFIALAKAGEDANRLEPAIEQLAEHYRVVRETRLKLAFLLLYPVVLTVCLLGVLAIIVCITPSFEVMYREMDIELPSVTLGVFFVAQHAVGIVVCAAVAAACMAAGLGLLWRIPEVRRGVESTLLAVPAVGPLLRASSLRHFCQTTGMLMTAGRPTVASLRHSADASPSALFSDAICRLVSISDQGGLIADGMQDSRLFPRHFVWLISTAERRGDLPEALCTVAGTFRSAAARHAEFLVMMASPVYVTFVVAPLVGFVVVALFMPLIRLMASIGT